MAIKWLEEVKEDDKPFYLFLHYIDAHNPLKAPVPYYKKFIDRALEKAIDKRKVNLIADNPLRHYTRDINLTEHENEYLIGLYDGEIAYLDKKVGEIVNYLKQSQLYENTVLIVTADHGEHFGEHGHYSHVASLYQEIIHIPMIMKLPSGNRRGAIDSKSAQLVDLPPTILGLANVESSANEITFSGVDLLDNGSYPKKRYIVSEWEGRVPYFVLNDLSCSVDDARVKEFRKKKWAIQYNEYKLIVSEDGKEELYQLSTDPKEHYNIINQVQTEGLELRSRLKEWRNSILKTPQETLRFQIDERTKENLKALGYM